MAPTRAEMTAQLTGRLDGPHCDNDVAAVARLVAKALRLLHYATRDGARLTFPARLCAVTGELAGAAARLSQVGRFLDRELAAGRLGDDQGSDPVDVAARTDDLQVTADAADTALAEALGAAQNYRARLHQAESGAAGQRDLAGQVGAEA